VGKSCQTPERLARKALPFRQGEKSSALALSYGRLWFPIGYTRNAGLPQRSGRQRVSTSEEDDALYRRPDPSLGCHRFGTSAITVEHARVSASTGSLGVRPLAMWTCPVSHPIKRNFTTYSGELCIFHMPGGHLYHRTKPERCYATEEEAWRDGCRRSKR
jgi:hypothetical protein